MRPPTATAGSPRLTAPRAAGTGTVEVARRGDATVVTRLRAQSPLKLLTPRRAGSHAAWVITSSYGGGLLGGDRVALDVTAGDGTTLCLGTQASTKVYHPTTGAAAAEQSLCLRVGAGATVVVTPDPITPFAGSAFEQAQRIELAADASLVLLDWMTSGRVARGERWAFRRYLTRTKVTVDGRPTFRDALLLDAADGPIASTCRTGGFDCFATVLLLGPKVAPHVPKLLDNVNQSALRHGSPTWAVASPIRGGAVVRLGATSTEHAVHWLRDRLGFAAALLGDDPWHRKW